MENEYIKRLDKLQRDITWIMHHLLTKDQPIQSPPYVPSYPYNNEIRCSKCGMVFSGITSYSCADSHCPTFAKTYCVSTTYANPAPESYFDGIRASRNNMSNAGDKDYED